MVIYTILISIWASSVHLIELLYNIIYIKKFKTLNYVLIWAPKYLS